MKTKTIVVGHDLSPLGDVAAKTAFAVARNVGATRVHLVHVVPSSVTTVPYPMSFAPTDAAALEAAQEQRAMAKLETLSPDAPEVTREVRIGAPARDLASAAADVDADLIVVASHGYGPVRRNLYGSVTSALLRLSSCPVLVVGESRAGVEFETVVAGVDLSPVARKVVEAAVTFTKPGGRTELVTAYEPPMFMGEDDGRFPHMPTGDDRKRFREAREAEVRALLPTHADVRTINIDALAKAPPANAILETAELLGANVIVVGTSGHSAWHRAFLGSTAMRVLDHAHCAVLFVPHAKPAR